MGHEYAHIMYEIRLLSQPLQSILQGGDLRLCVTDKLSKSP